MREEDIHCVQSFNTSIRIIEASQYSHKLSVALAGVNDLIAAEGQYHLKCYTKFLREASDVKRTADKNDLAMGWLCAELRNSASKGNVLELDEVWQYYYKLCEETNTKVQDSFISRRSSFKDKIESLMIGVYEFHVLHKSKEQDKGTVLIPSEFSHIPISLLLSRKEQDCMIPLHRSGDDIFLSLIHVALKLRSDILSHPPHKGFELSREAEFKCIPESLYMFLKILYGGQSVLENDKEEDPESDGGSTSARLDDRVLSVAQDIVFGTSNGKMWTPKHIGLGSTLHQSTRSKQLVELFHRAGHTVSYKNVLQVDTALAESTLQSLNLENGAIVPPNLVPNRFVHLSTDNIDIRDASLDGKETFHATQVTAWQRGPPSDTDTLKKLKPSEKTLFVPEVLTTTIPPGKVVGSPEPKFKSDVEIHWFTETQAPEPHTLLAQAKDMTFITRRRHESPRRGWSQYNQETSHFGPPISDHWFHTNCIKSSP